MPEVVLDVFPPCPECGWSGFPRYRWLSGEFVVREVAEKGRFYVTEARCSNCDAHHRLYRRVGHPDWRHGARLDEEQASA